MFKQTKHSLDFRQNPENILNKEGITELSESDSGAQAEKIYLLYDKADPWQIPKVMHQEDTRNHADLNLRYTFFVMKNLQMPIKFCSKSAQDCEEKMNTHQNKSLRLDFYVQSLSILRTISRLFSV